MGIHEDSLECIDIPHRFNIILTLRVISSDIGWDVSARFDVGD